MLAGMKKEDAFEYSFLLSIPAILGSFLFSLKKIFALRPEGITVLSMVVGTAIACLSGLFALYILKEMVIRKKLYFFSVYLWILSTVILIVI